MNQAGLISLGILIAAFVFQAATSRSRKAYRTPAVFFWGSAILIFAYYFYLVYAQYLAWKNGGGISKFLVPPYKSISYVFGYHLTRFLMYYLIAFVIAFLLMFLMARLNKKYGGRFFEAEEPYWGALSVLLLGNPAWNYAWIYYIAALLAVLLFSSIVISYWLKKRERVSLYWLWLPVAILVSVGVMFVF